MLAEFTLLNVNVAVDAICALPAGYAPAAKDNASRSVQLNQLQTFDQLDPDSTPAPGQVISKTIVFDAGEFVEIDLTDAPIVGAVDADGEPADGEDITGARAFLVQLCTCRESGVNAGPVTVLEGTSNGYAIFGSGNEVEVPPDSRLLFYVKTESLPLVSGTAKTIRFEGAEDDRIEVLIAFLNSE